MTLILNGTNGVSDVDGDASTPAVRGTDANTGIFFGSDVIGFSEGGTECARFNADAQFVAAAGTASLPVLTTTGDLNTGVFFPAADNIGFATGGTIRGRWTTDGLCFGTDTAAANALDDYEEGTWTPTIRGQTSAMSSVSYVQQTGRYTKIGDTVFVTFSVTWSAASGGTGDARVGGLPFAAGDGSTALAVLGYENVVAGTDFQIRTDFNTLLAPQTGQGSSGLSLSSYTSGSFNKRIAAAGCYKI